MRLKKKYRRIFLSAAIVIIVTVAGFILSELIPESPEEQVTRARIALSEAVSNDAHTYSKSLYREAKSLYDSAMVSWQRENQRFIWFRDYSRTVELAQMSEQKSRQASRISRNNVTDLNIFLGQKLEKLNHIAGQIDKKFDSYPLSAEVWSRISRGRMLLKESEVAYNKGDYSVAKEKVAGSELLLVDAYENANEHLTGYFNSYPTWKQWADRTIRESRKNQTYAIIVDKYSRKCIVYLGGVKKYEYNVELGKNWVGDKKEKGDKATPEGMYKVVRKFGSGRTKYHKALLIDYPNETDKAEFRKAVSGGTLPKTARIGSLIEIHGEGGRGYDWTEGCISLTNEEMDVVFRIAREGTPVTIVGSTISLDKLHE
ncbi:MAG: L,D-transpeptidase family protein [Bacteroidales bacterium]|jgi:L,D-peptidoglycan transpeptidase YkuD (ErfK/YbiS/YcfS/YnhG family)|nr:L,D-transpeptidase family protein [Bacteroidales bacterium]